METVLTGRPLDANGEPTDGPGIELDPDGPAADMLRDSPHALASSPGLGQWLTLLTDGDERPAILLWLSPDASELPPHWHTEADEYFRAVEGELTVVVDGEPHRLAPGDDLTVEPGRKHTFRNDTDDVVAAYVELPWTKTAETLLTVCGRDHEGAFGGDGEYGEPGLLHGLVMAEAVSEGTRIAAGPQLVQRALWATVGRVARARGHRAVDPRYLRDEFWERTVEQL